MNRSVVLGVAAAALVAAASFVGLEVRQEREFRRLIAVGDAALAQGQTFVAIEAFSGALALRPASMLAHLKRGASYHRRGEFADALRDLGQATRLDPTAPQPIELLGDVNGAMGQHAAAADHYRRFLQLDDRSARVLYKLAVAQFRNGASAAAIPSLEKAVALEDTLAEAHHLLGLSLREQARHDEAVRALTRAIDINPAFVGAREELAALHVERGRHREAILQLEAVAALEPDRPERMVMVAMQYARLGRPETAVLTLGRAAERFPDNPAVYAALGRLWLDTAEARQDPVAASKALEALAPAAARAEASSETLALYGRALLHAGNPTRAEEVLQLAVRRTPTDPSAFRYLAAAARRLGHRAAAADADARYQLLTAE